MVISFRRLLVVCLCLCGLSENRAIAQYGSQTDRVDSLKHVLAKVSGVARIKALNEISFLISVSFPDQAEEYANLALEESRRTGYTIGQALAIQRIGILDYRRGDYNQSVENLTQADSLFRITGDSLELSINYKCLGDAYLGFRTFPTAIAYYQKALNLCDSVRNPNMFADNLAGLGDVHRLMGELKMAYRFINRARLIYANQKDEYGYWNVQTSLAELDYVTGRPTEARNKFESALAYFEKSLDKGSVGNISNRLAKIYLDMKQLPQALQYAEKGLAFSWEAEAKPYVVDSYLLLYQIYKARGDYAHALTNHELYQKAVDDLSNMQFLSEINKIESDKARHEAESENLLLKKTNEIDKIHLKQQRHLIYSVLGFLILTLGIVGHLAYVIRQRRKDHQLIKSQNERLEKQTAQLMESNMFRNTLLDILAHDLKNSASSIVGLSRVMMDDDESNVYLKAIFKSGEKLIHVIAETAALAELMHGEALEKEKIGLKDMVQGAFDAYHLFIEESGMTYSIMISDELTVHVNPVLSSIFRNFIQNAVKYASGGKRIEAGAEQVNGGLKVFVKDFGQTIPAEKTANIFERKVQLNDNSRQGSGLGLSISKRIADAHNAKIGVEPNYPTGNIFYVILPDR
jgi:signal transduction histidine kinase